MGILKRLFQKEPEQPRKEPTLMVRQYEAAEGGRLSGDWMALATSEDSELAGSLETLRNRSRKMIRDNPHASNLKRIVQDNIVGTGIGVQAQVMKADGTPDDDLNNRIEEAWLQWSERDSCHTAGQLSMNSILRLAVGAVFQDGEVLIRKVQAACRLLLRSSSPTCCWGKPKGRSWPETATVFALVLKSILGCARSRTG